jgi:hypothetical protein
MFAKQYALAQSVSAPHAAPEAQGVGQMPPQSTSASPGLSLWSLHAFSASVAGD